MRCIVERLFLTSLLGALAVTAAAAAPAVGDRLSGRIDLGLSKQIPLPPGSYKVEVSFQDQLPVTNGDERARSFQVLTLSSTDPRSHVALVVLDYTQFARLNWNGQPCDTPPSNRPLVVQAHGTTSTSRVVKCSRVYAVRDFKGEVHRAAKASNAWWKSRMGGSSFDGVDLPNHSVLVTGYLARSPGDRLNYAIYLNPARVGLDDPAGTPPVFATQDRTEYGAAARRYVDSAAAWADVYMEAVEREFIDQRRGDLSALQALNLTGPAVASGRGQAPAAAEAPRPTAAAAAASPVVVRPPPAPEPTAPPSPPRQSVHALVIGNGAYGVARLANPRADATAVADMFKRFGFKVTLLQDASRRQLAEALAAFSGDAHDTDVSIIFYAGHGMQVQGVNYLIPVDMDLSGTRPVSVPLEAVSLDTVVQQHLPGKTRLVFLDACRDNPLARSLAGTRGGSTGLAPIQASSGTLISYATRDGSTAADGNGRNSPYTSSLLAHLDANEDIALVLRRVRQQVLSSTAGRQEPWEYGSLVGGALVLSRIASTR